MAPTLVCVCVCVYMCVCVCVCTCVCVCVCVCVCECVLLVFGFYLRGFLISILSDLGVVGVVYPAYRWA